MVIETFKQLFQFPHHNAFLCLDKKIIEKMPNSDNRKKVDSIYGKGKWISV